MTRQQTWRYICRRVTLRVLCMLFKKCRYVATYSSIWTVVLHVQIFKLVMLLISRVLL